MEEEFIRAAEFHGHICPGLAIGYRVAKYAKKNFHRSEDEELVCIAENDSCSVDAVQHMLGCTRGKGNLILKDHDKQAFTFYSRSNDKALRIYFKKDLSEGMGSLRERAFRGELSPVEEKAFRAKRGEIIDYILNARDDEILDVKEVSIPVPEKAKIYPSLECQECGEKFMEIKGRTAKGKLLCPECFEKLTR